MYQRFPIYLLPDLLTYTLFDINATSFLFLRQCPELIFFHQNSSHGKLFAPSRGQQGKNLQKFVKLFITSSIRRKLNKLHRTILQKNSHGFEVSLPHRSVIFVRNPSPAHYYLDWMMYDVINGYFAANCPSDYDFSACISSQRCTATANMRRKF